MNPLNMYIILPGLFGVCPQTRRVFFPLVKEVNFMKRGSLREKDIRHLLRDSMVLGLIKEGEGERVENGARSNRVKRSE